MYPIVTIGGNPPQRDTEYEDHALSSKEALGFLGLLFTTGAAIWMIEGDPSMFIAAVVIALFFDAAGGGPRKT
jgi:hypothetical protein